MSSLDCLHILIFDVKLLVYLGLHLFLFNLLARKICAVSYVYFAILEVSCMSFELDYSLHLQYYGSYIGAFLKGFPEYSGGH